MHPHLSLLWNALRAEEAHQRDEHTHAMAQPPATRVAMGMAWPPIRVQTEEPAGRQRSRWTLTSPRQALHDGIRSGESLFVAPAGSPYDKWWGRCLYAGSHEAEIIVETDEPAPAEVVVTKRFDPTTFVRYRQALERADKHGGPLVEALIEGRTAPGAEASPQDWSGLNDAQRHAASRAIEAEHLALVHGPPGTGKTRTLVAILQALVAAGDRPWALADANAAVDHLAVSAASAGLRVVRLGHPARMGTAAAALSIPHLLAAHPTADAIRAIDKQLSRLRRDSSWEARRQRRELYQDRERITDQARSAIIESAEVLAATFGSLVRLAPDLPPPHTAVVDEATQAMEPAVWSAVPWTQRLILAGDPHQLGPVVTQRGNPLQESLLHRLLAGGADAPMLEVQHRMHQDIHGTVQAIYGPAYQPHPSVRDHTLAAFASAAADELTNTPMLWIDTAGAGLDEQRDPMTQSLFNPGETKLVVLLVQHWLAAGIPAADIGIIAPYSAQVAALRRQPALRDVEIATVNAFQGREKEAIAACFVRSNPDQALGFVADGRRLTVALTRARRAWVGIGDTSTLASEPRFADLFDQLDAQGQLQSVWAPPWMDAL